MLTVFIVAHLYVSGVSFEIVQQPLYEWILLIYEWMLLISVKLLWLTATAMR
jgi:hypothetical protein